jgi:hypothetical protein
MSLQLSIKRFREAIEKLEDPITKIKMQIGYLLAARNSEILTETSPWDLLHNASKPYGLFMKYELQDFRLSPTDPQGMQLGLKEPINEKAFVISVAVAKRGKRITEKKREQLDDKPIELKPEEVQKAFAMYGQQELFEKWKKGEITVDPLLIKVLLGKITLKTVALPCNPKYEPWTLSLLRHYKEKKTLSFPITRQWFWKNYRQALKDLLPQKSLHSIKNPLRHFRINHIIEYYGFLPYDVATYSGWTIASTFGRIGIPVSSNIDAYSHLAWRMYFPRLLLPITQMK